MRNIISTIIFFTALIHIKAKYRDAKIAEYIFKPGTTLLIILVAILGNTSGNYKTAIITGLVFSLFGDIFLMLDESKFIMGLVSFLLAHIAYIFAFNISVSNYNVSLIFPFMIYGYLIFQYLSPGLKEMKIPVIVYLVIILLMGTSAANRYYFNRDILNLYAFSGSLLFMASDSTLAINKFRNKFYLAELIILTTYYIAQLLIAFSVG